MCRKFLEDEVNWRIVQSLLIIGGIVVAGFLAYQQNQINRQLLNLNFRTLVDFRYDEKSGIANLYNYGETPIYVEVARLSTFPEVKMSISIQKTIFPKQSIDLDFKKHLAIFLSNFKDNHYGGGYQLFLQIDTPNGRRTYIGLIGFGLKLKEGKIEYVIPSNNLSLFKYDGTALDFINSN